MGLSAIEKGAFAWSYPETARFLTSASGGSSTPAQQRLATTVENTIDRIKDTPQGQRALQKLEANIAGNAGFRDRLETLAERNPAALERAIPQMLQNPDRMVQIAQQAGAPRPAAAAAPAAAAPAAQPRQAAARPPETQGEEIVVTAPRNREDAAPAADRAEPASVAAAPVAGTANPFARLQNAPGGQEFMAEVSRNTAFEEALTSAQSQGAKDPAAFGRMVDDLATRAEQDPNFLPKLTDMMRDNPEAATTVARQIADNPQQAMQTLNTTMQQYDMMQNMQNMFGGGMAGGMGGAGGPLGMIMTLIMGIINMVSGGAGSSRQMLGMDNNGGGMVNDFLQGVGFNGRLTTVDPSNGTTAAFNQEARLRASGELQPETPQQQRQQPQQQVAATPSPGGPG